MKFVLVSSCVPFRGGDERRIVDCLYERLVERGHQAEIVRLPFADHDPDTIFRQILSYRLLDLSESGDRLIAFQAPAHLVRHPYKLLWFGQEQATVERWASTRNDGNETARDQAFRARLLDVMEYGMREAQRLFARSEAIQQRLEAISQIQSTVLPLPATHSGHDEPDETGVAGWDHIIESLAA